MAPKLGPWGRIVTSPRPTSIPATTTTASTPTQPPRTYTCESCGAVLNYAPGTEELVCAYCGHRNKVATAPGEVVEHDLDQGLQALAGEAPDATPIATKCASCGADFSFPANFHAGACPFCGMAAVADPGERRRIRPHAVLPFLIGEPEARRLLARWLEGLWFAPSSLAKEARGPGKLDGMYLPAWTFDARTRTDYTGQRGDVYYETQWVEQMVDGKRVRQAVQVPRIRWTPVVGSVARDFDDVLVPAGEAVPVPLVQRLEPWDLRAAKPYAADYLSGFASELYTLPLEYGQAQARSAMQDVIALDVRRDIGGDQQTIGRMEVEYRDQTFKHVLLPVWVATFRFLGRSYRTVVNARTGEVAGERPWSVWKITGAVLLVLLLVLGLLWLGEAGGWLDQARQLPRG